MPMVSIVLPTYNGEQYLRESIESVIAQTHTNWELIIVNDCSKDNTPNIAEEYALKDKRIRVIHNKINQKLPKSLNIGFDEAKGQYLTWTSDDNLYLPEAIKKMHDKLYNDVNLQMTCADMKYIDNIGNITGNSEVYDEKTMFLQNTVGACFMYKREVLTIVGGYDADRFCVEDFDYWQRILIEFKHIERIPEYLYLYRKHEKSLSVTKQKEVCYQRAMLHERNMSILFDMYKNDKNVLCNIYYEVMKTKYNIADFKNKCLELVPELKKEIHQFSSDEKFLIFGAGEFGEKAVSLLGENAVGFIDNDKNKTGKYKDGLLINSLQQILDMKENTTIMVAVDCDKTYNLINQLMENGINRYATYFGYSEYIE